jgi:predicted permease
MRRVRLIENLTQDIRYAVRTLAKAPAFAAVVVATLALGIGGITAVFSVVQAVLLEPLPYEAPGQLVRVYQQENSDIATRNYVSGAHFRAIRDLAPAFQELAAIDNYQNRESGLDLVDGAQAQRLRVLRVTSGYFQALRSGALRGRGFEREDENGARLVILSDPLWRNRFGADPAVVGRNIHLSGEAYTVVGIAPDGFQDPVVGAVDAWLPYDLVSNTNGENYSLTVVGRLRNGASMGQPRAELAALSRSLAERWPKARLNTLAVEPLKDDLVAHSRGTLNALSLAVAMVLLVACLNVANLFLVRATGRVREFAIRSALGSGGVRIAGQLLVESVLLGAAGGLAGLGLAAATLRGLRTLGAGAIPRLAEVGLDPTVLGVTAVVTLATGIVFGMMPAIRFSRIDPSRALHQRSRSATGDRAQGRVRTGLAVLQVAFALILLFGAGTLTTNFYRLRQLDYGFRDQGVLTFELTLPSARYNAPQRATFYEELTRRIEGIPGVTFAGGVSRLPATGSFHPWGTSALTGPLAGTGRAIRTQQRVVSGDFFAALAIPVLAGRVFDGRDDVGAPERAVVSARFARLAFPGIPLESVIGQRLRVLGLPRQIIGVVGDVALDAHSAPAPAVYHAHRQFADNRNWALTQVVSTRLPLEQVLPPVRAAVSALDSQLVVHRPAPMSEVVGRGIARERFTLVLMAAFALVALGLASVGLYGVLAYSVRQRTHEFGIRMALGATASHVRGLVLRQAAVVLGIGLAIGTAGALALGRWLSALIVETSPPAPRVLIATAALLAAVAFLSAWLPAWRASRVEPCIAMHEE